MNHHTRPLRLFALCLVIGAHLCAVSYAEKEWETLQNCRLLKNESNDGDSFHVEYKGKEHIFRLYYVDAPENEGRLADRIAEQARYWGIPYEAILKLGKAAAKFTAGQLASGFTVTTRWSDARGQSQMPRYYAFVTVSNKERSDLGELLVAHGLGRVFGESATTPAGLTMQQEFAKLDRLEAEARRNRLGAWSPAAKDISPDGADAEITTHRLFVPSGERHNSKCPMFNAPNTRPCGSDEGKPCKICGG